MNIGKSIQTFRKKKGLRQSYIAQKCGITTTYLSQIENDKKDPTIATLKKICGVLEVPLPVLIILSLTDDDVPTEKKESFKYIMPSFKKTFEDVFII